MSHSSRLQTSRSAAIRATLDYPVIDTDVHTNRVGGSLISACSLTQNSDGGTQP